LRLGETSIAIEVHGARRVIPLARSGELPGLVAHSVKMRACAAALRQLASSDIAVLIEGETGAGKEVAAQAIHLASGRHAGPFVVFDCTGTSAALAAASLFGHKKGAFTGAEADRSGLFDEAEGGTLLIDEICELPLDLQPLLLGAIDRKAFRPLGGAMRTHDVRIIATTHRNLGEAVREKRFREDLFFRMAAARVKLPPLRERLEDIEVLTRIFAAEEGAVLTPTVMGFLTAHHWPGNVRELRNTIARLAAQPQSVAELAQDSQWPTGPVTDRRGAVYPLPEARHLASVAFERHYLAKVLELAKGSVAGAAKLAGVSRRLLTRLAAKHDLRLRDRDP
jgi:DNA-binding NtrC family response regulator